MMEVFLQLCVLLLVAAAESSHRKEYTDVAVIFTQQWPMTFCLEKHAHQEPCVIPDNVTFWTIHGLWPKNGEFCNASWPFNETKIKELVPLLKLYWPDLKGHGSEFWKYEWDKHGTCAGSLPEMNSEFKYFNKALELHHNQNLLKILSNMGIVPSLKNTYKFADIEMAFHKAFGVKPKVQCIKEKDQKQMLGQIEVCLNKSLLPIACRVIHQYVCRPLVEVKRDGRLPALVGACQRSHGVLHEEEVSCRRRLNK
uniref:Ribonuclease T2 n=1 Tax=Eptatretus burgeri TaxID=7764 RepID=A0A8C4NC68_EPTBU